MNPENLLQDGTPSLFKAKIGQIKCLYTAKGIVTTIGLGLICLAVYIVPIFFDNIYKGVEAAATLKERETTRKVLVARGFARYNEMTGEYYLRTADQVAGDPTLISASLPVLTGTNSPSSQDAVLLNQHDIPRTQSSRKREAGPQ